VAVTPAAGSVLGRLSGLRALIVGDAMLDTYLCGESHRLCQEAPVPIVTVTDRTDVPGGAANTAANARALGAEASLLAVLGEDGEGRTLRRVIENAGVETRSLLVEPGRRTLAKQRVLAGAQMLLRFDQGCTGRLAAPAEAEIARRMSLLAPRSDAIIVSDYGYGVLAPPVIEALVQAQRASPRALVVDARSPAAYRKAQPTAVKPNFHEACRLLGDSASGERVAAIARRGHELLDLTGARIVAVTLDAEGALFFERDREPYRTYARPAPHNRAAGAGDTFAVALALALAAGAGTQVAAEIAAAAAVAVAKEGTATCSLAELRAYLEGGEKLSPSAEALSLVIEAHRRAGKRVVLTSGCFDLLHRGHVACLHAAKALGDVLIVGLNSDAGVRRLKGPTRPINPLADRARVLAALSCVDHIVAFDEDTPEQLVGVVRPHVFVKGGDYREDDLPEARAVRAYGGEIRILPYVEDRSTTSIIRRIAAASTASPAASSMERA
jgi:D-beta-D-heptose 7-phosphate kinase/D-beta-D-heptose 1-phosphate adenosyltransferase